LSADTDHQAPIATAFAEAGKETSNIQPAYGLAFSPLQGRNAMEEAESPMQAARMIAIEPEICCPMHPAFHAFVAPPYRPALVRSCRQRPGRRHLILNKSGMTGAA
jgi:hypothetical protein